MGQIQSICIKNITARGSNLTGGIDLVKLRPPGIEFPGYPYKARFAG
jgi:hypothetical protein